MRLVFLISALVTIFTTGCAVSNNAADKNVVVSSPSIAVKNIALGSYSAQISQTANPPYIAFFKNGKLIHKETCETGNTLSVFEKTSGAGRSTPASPGMPKSMRAQANYVIHLEEGELPVVIVACKSADGISKYLVFRLDNMFGEIASVSAGYDSLKLDDVGDDNYELLSRDRFPAWGAANIAPEVLLKWNGKALVLDLEGMKDSKPLLISEITSLRAALAPEFDSLPTSDDPISLAPPELASQVFDLYYGGQGKYAAKLFDSCWPANHTGKKAYWNFLMQQMRSSPYWSQIEALNKQ